MALSLKGKKKKPKYSKGIIGVASSFLGRYREFDSCLAKVAKPQGTVIEWGLGVNVAYNYNTMIRTLLKEEEDFKWLWILGDDHVFKGDLLLNLLDRDVDVVVPLCLRRSKPFFPVIHGTVKEGFYPKDFEWLSGKQGLLDVTDIASLGNAGMLVKRHVFEECNKPWFVNGQIHPELNSSDLYFFENLKQNGFKVHLDLDNHIGHLTHVAVWPARDKELNYGPDLRVP